MDPISDTTAVAVTQDLFSNTPFKVLVARSKETSRIFLLSTNLDFLKKTWQLVMDYTRKIDPLAPVLEGAIKDCSLKTRNVTSLTHYVELSFPRTVQLLYGDNNLTRCYGNCHGTALVAIGLFPVLANFTSPFSLSLTSAKTESISIRELEAGDLVYLKGRHSFVFLNQDLCLSMNGRGQPLELQKTKDVLTTYGSAADSLEPTTKENLTQITVLRKKQDWTCPEAVMKPIVDYYGFANNSDYFSISGEDHGRFQSVVQKLKTFAEQVNISQESALYTLTEPAVQEAWVILYRKITGDEWK